jgi:SAM-dependent methyltransferase
MMEVLHDHGIGPEDLRSVLDFGCGCGRVVRYWQHFSRMRVYGVDTNRHLLRWCKMRLGFGDFRATGMRPPLPFEDKRFDLIYAFSVFTHLTEELQLAWMDELERVLRPGGYLVISTHGQRSAHDLPNNLKRRFDDGHLVVSLFGSEGGNDCNAFHPPGYFEKVIARRFTTVAFRSEGAAGNPPQDLFLLRKDSELEE